MSQPVADRNLLFGLLALQNGLIDQSALVAAFHAWTRDKTRSLAGLLIAQGAIDDGDGDLLEGLVARHLRGHGGDAGRSIAAVAAPRSLVTELASLGDADLEATLGHAGPGRTRPSRAPAARPSRWAWPPATAGGSASSVPTPGAAWARSSWRSTPS